MKLHYTKYTKEGDDGKLEFGFVFPVADGVPLMMLVGSCSISQAHVIGKKLDDAEWAAKAIIERYLNPPPTRQL